MCTVKEMAGAASGVHGYDLYISNVIILQKSPFSIEYNNWSVSL